MRIPFGIGIRAQGAYIPQNKIITKDLMRSGLLSLEDFHREAYRELYNETNKSSSEMALAAADEALKSSGLSGTDIDLIVFSSTLLKDKACWSASAFLAENLGAENAEFIDLYQGCNGVMASVEYVISRFHLLSHFKNAIVVSSELFPPSITKKWDCDYNAFYGDAAGAWLLQRDCESFKIESTSSFYNAELNDFISMEYGSYDDIIGGFKHEGYFPKKTKKVLLEKMGRDHIHALFDKGTKSVLEIIKKDMGSNFHFGVLPNYGKMLVRHIAEVVEIPLEKSTLELGLSSGHLGTVDPIMNLYRSDKEGKLISGEKVFILSHGAGVSVMGMGLTV